MAAILSVFTANPNRAIFLSASLLSLTAYLLTAASTVGFHDAGEFALRAFQLGATHAPGAPLFVLIGHVIGWIVPNPVLAASLVSVISASVTVGLVGVLLYSLTKEVALSLLGGLLFSSLFIIWGNAVISEAYALSLLFVAWSVVAVFSWRKSVVGGSPYFPWQIALLYGFALAAHFANILLLPAYLLIFLQSERDSWLNFLKFILTTIVFIVIISVCNILLAINTPPFGAVSPDSFVSLFLYMSGSQHDPLMLRDANFYWTRISEHFLIFNKNYWFVLVPVGLVGAVRAYLRDRVSGSFLVLVYLIYMGYFTLFGSGDYFLMVGPAYFVFSIWVMLGLVYLSKFIPGRFSLAIVPLMLLVLVASSFAMQFGGRYRAADSDHVEKYVRDAFSVIPESSIVIARWSEFTALNYMQVVEGMRPDLKIVVPARELRLYEHGGVEDYLAYVSNAICHFPVVTNKITADMEEQYHLILIANNSEWHQLESKMPCLTAN
jgi:hypothetical protein